MAQKKSAAPAGARKATAVKATASNARTPKPALPQRSAKRRDAASATRRTEAPVSARPAPAKGAGKASSGKPGAARPAAQKSEKPAPNPLKPSPKAPTTKAPMGNSVTAKRSKGSETKAAGAKPAKAKAAAPKASAPKGKAKAAPPPPAPIVEAPVEVVAEVPRAPVKPVNPERPTLAELRQMPTDDMWGYYRKAAHARPKDEKFVEDLRNVLMEAHLPLVKHIAERLLQTLPKSIELGDLESAGAFGLMDAIRGFDPDRGIKFKTYCTTRIRGSILDQLRSQDWVPRLVRLKASRIEKTLHRLQGEYGREPTHAELANALQMDHGELSLEITQSRAKTMHSLSERWDDRDDENSTEKIEIVEDEKASDPVNELNRRDLMLYITKSLNHKERFIIEQYYDVGHTMREIGEMLALTESRVCQIHSNVMLRLKGLLTPNSSDLEA